MRIAIREQLAALVIFTVLISLAVISIPTWMFVNNFVVNIESQSLALTASLKASQIRSELELVQTTLQIIATRRSIQDALQSYYGNPDGNSPNHTLTNSESYWAKAKDDLLRALQTGRYTNLLQARIYANNTTPSREYDGGLLNLSSTDSDHLILPYPGPNGEDIHLGDEYGGYPGMLYPNISYTTGQDDDGRNKTLAEPFPDIMITANGGLLLGPLIFNETFSLISLTAPIWRNGTIDDILGYMTIVATANSLVFIQGSTDESQREGLGNTGSVLLIGPSTEWNRFSLNTSQDSPVSTESTSGDGELLQTQQVHFVLPPITPKITEDRHPHRNFKSGDFSSNFPLKQYPAAYLSFYDQVDTTGSSILSTHNEEGVAVAVGYARPQTNLVNWTVIVEKSRAEAYVPVVTLKHILLGCVFATAGVSLLLVYPSLHRFILPIRRLKSATEKSIAPPGYAESFDSYDYDGNDPSGSGAHSHRSKRGFFGNLKRLTRRRRRRSSTAQDDQDPRRQIFKIPGRVEDRRHFIKDELTELTKTFNEMSDELYKQYTLLDEKVAERTRELEVSKKAAEAANESKTLFIANISHELKTPLNGIMGMCSICMEETDIDKIHQSLKTLYKSGDILLHLLDDLLSFSKNQIGQQLSLDEKEFRLNDIKQQILVIFDKQVRQGQIDFNVRFLSTDMPELTPGEEEDEKLSLPAIGPNGTGRLKDMCLWGDQHRILQVIINLVSNSLKFTPPGGKVELRIRCLNEVENGTVTGDVSRSSSTSKNQTISRGGRSRHRGGSSGNTQSTPRVAGLDLDNFPVQISTAVLINPAEPKTAPVVAPIRERSPTPPPPNTKSYIFEFEVEDTGPGIAENMQKKVFEPFVQGDLGLSRKFGGTGLGLSICQQLATLMGGSITLESTVGVGTKFTMRIPLKHVRDRPPSMASSIRSVEAQSVPSLTEIEPPSPRNSRSDLTIPRPQSPQTVDETATEAISRSPKPRLVGLSQPFFAASADPSPASSKDDPISNIIAKPDFAGLRVLVADDNNTNVTVVSRMLELERIGDVVIARDGLEALDCVTSSLGTGKQFDLIFMDIQMPNLDGIECTRRIRKAGYRAPIIALSAFSDEINIRQCMSSGMNDFLSKPIKRPALKNMLRRFTTIPEESETPPFSRQNTSEGGRASSHSSHTVIIPGDRSEPVTPNTPNVHGHSNGNESAEKSPPQ